MIITNRTGRVKPSGDWAERVKPTTNYNERIKPYKYRTPLRDLNNIVCNENWKVIFIFANEGIPVPTMWHTR